jgi:hypothetical protein
MNIKVSRLALIKAIEARLAVLNGITESNKKIRERNAKASLAHEQAIIASIRNGKSSIVSVCQNRYDMSGTADIRVTLEAKLIAQPVDIETTYESHYDRNALEGSLKMLNLSTEDTVPASATKNIMNYL